MPAYESLRRAEGRTRKADETEPPRKHVNIDNAEISLNLYQATTNVELEDFAFTDG